MIQKLVASRYLFIPQALGSVSALIIGPFQFSTRLRSKHLQVHRHLGRLYAYSVFAAAFLAVVLNWNDPAFVRSTVQATAWFLCTLFAVMTARNRHLLQHRQWMIRSYAMTCTFVSACLLKFWPTYADMSDAAFNVADYHNVSLGVYSYDRLRLARHYYPTRLTVRQQTAPQRQNIPGVAQSRSLLYLADEA